MFHSDTTRWSRGLRTSAAIFDQGRLTGELAKLEEKMAADADFWKDQEADQKVMQRRKRIEADLGLFDNDKYAGQSGPGNR